MGKIRILILSGCGLGDQIKSIVLLRNMRKRYPEAEIHYLWETVPPKPCLLEQCPYINKIITINTGIERILPSDKDFWQELLTLRFIPDAYKFIRDILKLKRQKYDLIFDGFPATKRTRQLIDAVKQPNTMTICCSSSPEKDKYTLVFPIQGKNIIEAENNSNFFDSPDLKLELFSQVSETKDPKTLGFTTGHVDKCGWNYNQWVEFLKKVKADGYEIRLFGGDDQEEAYQTISKEVEIKDYRFDHIEKSIFQISKLEYFICPNGGLMWCATASGIKTITLGFTTPYWWDAPRWTKTITLRKAPASFYQQAYWSLRQEAEPPTVEEVYDILELVKMESYWEEKVRGV